METVVVTKNLKNQSVIMGKTVAKLEKLIMQIYGDKINNKNLSKMSKDYDTYIFTAYNNKSNLGEQVHTVSITVENGKYVIHNNGDDKRYNSLEEAIKGFNNGKGEPISIIGIKKKGAK